MSVQEEIREEQKKLKGKGLKYKLSYFWDYYRIHTIVVVCVIVFGSFIARDMLENSKPSYLDAVFANTTLMAGNEDSTIVSDYIEYAGIDMNEYNLYLDFSTVLSDDFDKMTELTMASQQKMMAMFAAEQIDIFCAPKGVIENFSVSEVFGDITALLPADLMEEIEAKGYEIFYYDTEDGRTIPGGIYVDGCEYLKRQGSLGLYPASDEERLRPVLTITANAKNMDHVIEFLRMITSY